MGLDDRSTAGRIGLALLISAAAAMSAQAAAPAARQAPSIGLFQAESNVGNVSPAGSAHYDATGRVYTIESAGANAWYHVDHFNYLWLRAAGDLALTARISFPPHRYSHDSNPHRKGLLMFRQSLAPGSAYVDAALHGVGLTALQYRREQGGNTPDIELTIDAPQTLRLEKRGDVFTLYVSQAGEPLHQVGASVRLHLRAPFYVGLGALSHDAQTTDVIEFSHVSVQRLKPMPAVTKRTLYSTLQTIEFTNQYRRAVVIRTVPTYMQSADWAPDGKSILVYEGGRIERIPYLTPDGGGQPQPIAVRALVGCSGNFGLSPDGKLLAVSCSRAPGGLHQVYLLPAAGGGAPRQLTRGALASFFHAWSPDGKIVAFTRGAASRADIFTVPTTAGQETRLTRDTVNDGPVYSPDGQYIYFDSSRSGMTQIWRMRADGSEAEQMTDDDFLNSSPHLSPDGSTLAFLSQPAGRGSGFGPAVVRVMRFDDGLIQSVVELRGDRGSFSMQPWGNAKRFAFITYQELPGDAR
jgi:TolB protein